MYAEAVGYHMKLVLFGWRMVAEYTTKGAAEAEASKWNDHLDDEWHTVREATATLVQSYTEALQRLGVDPATCTQALKEVSRHGK